MNETLPAHFLMAPSSAARWMRCPGSLRVEHPAETGDNLAANRGTMGHTMVERFLNDQVPVCVWKGYTLEEQRELTEAVDMCYEFVRQLRDEKGYELKLEKKIPDNMIEEHGGTIDVIAVKGLALHVIDYKFGRVAVDIEDNKQIMCYLNLARQLYPQCELFSGTIIQPYHGPPMTLEFSLEQLDEHDVDVLEASISDEFHAGDHCTSTFCPLLATCTTAGQKLKDDIQNFPDLTTLVADIDEQPTDKQMATLAAMYKTGKMAAAVCDDAGAMIKQYAAIGADFTPHKIKVSKTTTMTWKDRKSPHRLAKHYNLADSQYLIPSSCVSPAAMRGLTPLTLPEFRKAHRDQLDFHESQKITTGKLRQRDLPEFDNLIETE